MKKLNESIRDDVAKLDRIVEGMDHSEKYLALITPWQDAVQQDGVDPYDLAMDIMIDNPWIVGYYRSLQGFEKYSKGQIRQQVAVDLA